MTISSRSDSSRGPKIRSPLTVVPLEDPTSVMHHAGPTCSSTACTRETAGVAVDDQVVLRARPDRDAATSLVEHDEIVSGRSEPLESRHVSPSRTEDRSHRLGTDDRPAGRDRPHAAARLTIRSHRACPAARGLAPLGPWLVELDPFESCCVATASVPNQTSDGLRSRRRTRPDRTGGNAIRRGTLGPPEGWELMAAADVSPVPSSAPSTTCVVTFRFGAPVHPLSTPGRLRLASIVRRAGRRRARGGRRASRHGPAAGSRHGRARGDAATHRGRGSLRRPGRRRCGGLDRVPPGRARAARASGPLRRRHRRRRRAAGAASPASPTCPTKPGPAIATIAQQLPVYTGLVESARTNSRLDFPVGAAYLRRASDLMRTSILPAATSVYEDAAQPPLPGLPVGHLADGWRRRARRPAGLLVVLLLGSQLLVARRTRRIVNLGLVGATVLVVALGAWALAAFDTQQDALVRSQREGSDQLVVLSTARILASAVAQRREPRPHRAGNRGRLPAGLRRRHREHRRADGTTGLLGTAAQSRPGPAPRRAST